VKTNKMLETKVPLQSLLGHIWWHVPHLNKSQIQLWLGRVALGAFFQMAKHGRPTLFASPDWLDFRTTILRNSPIMQQLKHVNH